MTELLLSTRVHPISGPRNKVVDSNLLVTLVQTSLFLLGEFRSVFLDLEVVPAFGTVLTQCQEVTVPL